MRLTGRETPSEVMEVLASEGYWPWDTEPLREVWTNGTEFVKVAFFPSRPTPNHLEATLYPDTLVWSTPTFSVIATTNPAPPQDPWYKA